MRTRHLSFLVALLVCPVASAQAPAAPAAKPAAAAKPARTTLTVRVEGPDGALVSGARVFALAKSDGTTAPPPLAEAVAADGSATLAVEGECPCTVRAEAPGFAAAVERGEAGETVVVKLTKGAVVEGQVFDSSTSRPLADAEVVVTGRASGFFLDPADPERFELRGKSGEDGRFRITGALAEEATVVARAAGYREARRDLALVEGANPALTFFLAAGVPLSGKVVDPAGKPVAGATVQAGSREFRAMIQGASAGVLRTRTRKDGTFTFHGLPPARAYVLVVEHPDFAPAHSPDINATAGRRPAPVTLTLRPGGSVKARLQAGEEPYAGEVTVQLRLGVELPEHLRRDHRSRKVAGGALVIDHLPEGTHTLTLQPEGYADVPEQKVTIEAGKPADLGTLELTRGPSIAGRVVDGEGQPLAGAEIAALAIMPGGAVEREATSAEDGTFTLGGLTENLEYQVSAGKAKFGRTMREGVKVGGEPLELVLERASTVSGRVVAGDPPAPVTYLTVEAARASDTGGMAAMVSAVMGSTASRTLRSADGSFAVPDVSPGVYTVTVTSPGYVPARLEKVTVERGDPVELGEIVLAKGATLRVTVTDKKTKAPLGGAAVAVAETGVFAGMREMMGRNPGKVSGPDGRVTLDGLTPGRLTLKVKREGYAAAKQDVEVAPEALDVDATVALSQGGAVEGNVRDPQGRTMAGALVMITTGMDADPDLMDQTDEGGNYRIARIPPGGYMLITMPTPTNPAEQSEMMAKMQMQAATIEEDKTLRLDFPIGGAGKVTVRGTVRRGAKPVSGRMFWVKDTEGGGIPSDFVTGTIGADGGYEVRLAGGGRYLVRVQYALDDPTHPGFGARVEIPEKPEVEQDVVEPAGAIAGSVIDADTAQPVGGASLIALRLDAKDEREVDTRDPTGSGARTDETGRYRIAGLAEGKYRVVASAPGYASKSLGPIDQDADDEEGLQVALERPTPLEVRLAGDNGAPIQGGIVVPEDELFTSLGRLEGFTDGTGRAVLRQLGRGTHVLIAIAPGFAAKRVGNVTIGAEAPEPLAITLERGGGLKLTVTDAAGQPVANAGLRIREDNGPDVSNLAYFARIMAGKGFGFGTNAAGIAEIEPLPPGKLELEVVRANEVLARKTVTIRSGETETVAIKLP